MYTHICMYVCIYIYIDRERESKNTNNYPHPRLQDVPRVEESAEPHRMMKNSLAAGINGGRGQVLAAAGRELANIRGNHSS